MPKAYPFYDARATRRHVATLAAWLAEHAPNVYPVGRNGMHRYNNQDHSMLTAMLSVENIFGADHDIWSVNVEAEYHEETAPAERRQGFLRRSPCATRSRTPHHVTSVSSSAAMRQVIFECAAHAVGEHDRELRRCGRRARHTRYASSIWKP